MFTTSANIFGFPKVIHFLHSMPQLAMEEEMRPRRDETQSEDLEQSGGMFEPSCNRNALTNLDYKP
jgi:hypothetical protein